jgi:hypothetical protein
MEKVTVNQIPLPENSVHIIVPDWTKLKDAKLEVLVDLNNDQEIDDTLYFNNQATGFENDGDSLILRQGLYMSQNYPNPFSRNTSITYRLPAACHVTVKVLDLVGNEVATLVNDYKPAGNYKAEFDASVFSPGIYFYKLETGSFSLTKKMIVNR